MSSSVCLEALTNSESKSPNLERTFAIDITIYIMNRLFRMHQDVLDQNWIEILTADTKIHKIDGTLIALKTRKQDHQKIGIIKFSKGKKAPIPKMLMI
ncbi:720_t:CDS:2, partial [Funneliformis caledonium]